MTLKELKKIHPTATKQTWHRHKNGGGWVENTATVTSGAKIHKDAQVFGRARVTDSAEIYGQAQVYGNASVSGYARVIHHAEVFGNAGVTGNAWVRGSAKIYGNASVSGYAHVAEAAHVKDYAVVTDYANVYGDVVVCDEAHIGGEAAICGTTVMRGKSTISARALLMRGDWNISPLHIQGSKAAITVTDQCGHVRIGCKTLPIDVWLQDYQELGRHYQYTEAEIAEYKMYLYLVRRWIKTNFPNYKKNFRETYGYAL